MKIISSALKKALRDFDAEIGLVEPSDLENVMLPLVRSIRKDLRKFGQTEDTNIENLKIYSQEFRTLAEAILAINNAL